MVRKSWAALSPAYRNRLQKAGITQAHYDAGASLTAARGHSQTPEHPERAEKQPTKYHRYLNERNRLVQLVVDRKQRLFGSRPKYNNSRSGENVKKGVPNIPGYTRKPPTITELRQALKRTDHQILADAASQKPEKSYLWYH